MVLVRFGPGADMSASRFFRAQQSSDAGRLDQRLIGQEDNLPGHAPLAEELLRLPCLTEGKPIWR